MTVFAPTGTTSITIPPHRGGCGQSHEAGGLLPGEHMSVTCPACEPAILAMRGHGWATDPTQVALTPDERKATEDHRSAADRALTGLIGAFHRLGMTPTNISATPPAAPAEPIGPPSPAETAPSLDALTDEELAEMQARITAAQDARRPASVAAPAKATPRKATPRKATPAKPTTTAPRQAA